MASVTAIGSISKFPTELVFKVQVIAITEHVHEILCGEANGLPGVEIVPEVDIIKTLLQTNTRWRNVAAKIVSDMLGIQLTEDGSLESSPWYPLRTLHIWAAGTRQNPEFARLFSRFMVTDDFPFLARSAILRAYFGVLSMNACLRFNTLEDLADEFADEKRIEQRLSFQKLVLDLPSSDLSDEIGPVLHCHIRLFLTASATASVATRLDTAIRVVKLLMGNPVFDSLDDRDNWAKDGNMAHFFQEQINDIESYIQADRILFFPDRLVKIFHPAMKELQRLMDELTDEQAEMFGFRSVWSHLPHIVSDDCPHCLKI